MFAYKKVMQTFIYLGIIILGEVNKMAVKEKKNIEQEDDMSETLKCPGCNLRKRKLYSWFDNTVSMDIEICEDCIFLRELEEELILNLDNENNQRVLIDYEAFNVQKQKIFPYKWLLYHILKAYLDQKEGLPPLLIFDNIIDEWGYKNINLETEIIPKFVEWNIIKSPQPKTIEGQNVKVIEFGSFLDNLMKVHLKKTVKTGKFESLGSILRLVEGRIGFGIESQTSFKDRIRRKLTKIVLKSSYNKDTGKIKEEQKVIEIKEYRCKICNEVADLRYKIYKHIETTHVEITLEDIDDNVKAIDDLIGVKVPREKIARLDELKTYGAAWRVKLAELFKRDAFFADSDITRKESVMVISAPWAKVLEKVNEKVKLHIKAKEKIKTKI